MGVLLSWDALHLGTGGPLLLRGELCTGGWEKDELCIHAMGAPWAPIGLVLALMSIPGCQSLLGIHGAVELSYVLITCLDVHGGGRNIPRSVSHPHIIHLSTQYAMPISRDGRVCPSSALLG